MLTVTLVFLPREESAISSILCYREEGVVGIRLKEMRERLAKGG